MQAIILAAGMGRRLGELTEHNTKCMVQVNGISLIDRLLLQLSKYSLNRVVIVVGYKGEKLKKYIGNRYNNLLNIEYITNPIYEKTNNIYSLALAKNLMVEDDTLLLESDLIFEDKLLDLIINNPFDNLALVDKYESWMDGTMVVIDDDNNIVNFVPKKAFQYSEIGSYYKTVNIYKFSKEFAKTKYVPFLNAYCEAVGNNEYYEQVLRVITYLDNSDLKALPINNEKWYEIDDLQDLDIAECLFASESELLKRYYRRFGGYWRFPSMLDFCYLVNPYFPSKRMLDEMKANFTELLTEYPSGMRINSLIAGKFFGIKQEYIIPGNGAAEFIKILMEGLEGKLGLVFPTFEEYPNRFSKDRQCVYIPENKDFHYSAKDLIKYFDESDISTLLLINPDNPSGNFICFSDLCVLAEWCERKNIRFILDESFVDFSHEYDKTTMLSNSILEKYSKMIVVKSISKSYGVPGLRLGILASADVDFVNSLKREVSIWNINSFAEFFMQIYSKYKDDYLIACSRFLNERKWLYNELCNIPFLRIIPSEANYFLIEVINTYTSRELTIRLLKDYFILIKDCSQKYAFNGKNYIRIAIRNRADNQRLVDALRNLKNENNIG